QLEGNRVLLQDVGQAFELAIRRREQRDTIAQFDQRTRLRHSHRDVAEKGHGWARFNVGRSHFVIHFAQLDAGAGGRLGFEQGRELVPGEEVCGGEIARFGQLFRVLRRIRRRRTRKSCPKRAISPPQTSSPGTNSRPCSKPRRPPAPASNCAKWITKWLRPTLKRAHPWPFSATSRWLWRRRVRWSNWAIVSRCSR